uniref:Transmembrane protein 268 n=1 Tax=Malurus cyaneus samueli TaxID=2593467 RepID=A0A8C5UF39_9PASS
VPCEAPQQRPGRILDPFPTQQGGFSLPCARWDQTPPVLCSQLLWALAEPPQGRVLLVLSMDNTCPTSSFDLDLCAHKLQALGLQVPLDPCRRLIQDGLLTPEMRRFLFYSSRGFQIAMAVVFYISVWTNLYSTLRLCSLGQHWGTGVLVTLVAMAVTVLVILVIDRHQRKLNVNTDVRLAAVNEIFIKHNLILGITDVLDGPRNILKVSFLLGIVQDILLDIFLPVCRAPKSPFLPQAGLRHSLDRLRVVVDGAAQDEEEEAPCEESPLLSSGVTPNKDPMPCTELLRLVPEGPAEVMAQQLLVLCSGCYVRLLVTGRLPRAMPGGHLEHSSVPCPCQFIQSAVLSPQHGWGRTR